MMVGKVKVLSDIINFNGDVLALNEELSTYNWDSPFPLISLSFGNVQHAIGLFLQGSIDASLLENWANILECREDIEYETETVQQMIVELANPVLYGALTAIRVNEISSLQ
jgi:hypothetical protein